MAHSWPGNVRELKNVIESMVVVDYDGVLDVDDLPEDLVSPSTTGWNDHAAGAPSNANVSVASGENLIGPIARRCRKVLHRRNPEAHGR